MNVECFTVDRERERDRENAVYVCEFVRVSMVQGRRKTAENKLF